MKEHAENLYKEIKQSLKEWSALHFVFDAGLTFMLSIIIAAVAKLHLSVSVLLIIATVVTVTSGIELCRRFMMAEPHNLIGAKALIRQLARLIPEPKSGIEMSVERVVTSQMSMLVPKPNDWTIDTATALRIIVRSDIAHDYENCLKNDNPNNTAKLFLLALADTLTTADLRGAPVPS